MRVELSSTPQQLMSHEIKQDSTLIDHYEILRMRAHEYLRSKWSDSEAHSFGRDLRLCPPPPSISPFVHCVGSSLACPALEAVIPYPFVMKAYSGLASDLAEGVALHMSTNSTRSESLQRTCSWK